MSNPCPGQQPGWRAKPADIRSRRLGPFWCSASRQRRRYKPGGGLHVLSTVRLTGHHHDSVSHQSGARYGREIVMVALRRLLTVRHPGNPPPRRLAHSVSLAHLRAGAPPGIVPSFPPADPSNVWGTKRAPGCNGDIWCQFRTGKEKMFRKAPTRLAGRTPRVTIPRRTIRPGVALSDNPDRITHILPAPLTRPQTIRRKGLFR